MCEQRIADGVAVGACAGEAMPREQVGQSGERRAILNAGDQILRGAQPGNEARRHAVGGNW